MNVSVNDICMLGQRKSECFYQESKLWPSNIIGSTLVGRTRISFFLMSMPVTDQKHSSIINCYILKSEL